MKPDASRAKQPLRLKEPTRREVVPYYTVGGAAALVYGGVAIALEWSRVAFMLGAFIFVAVYVPIALMVLFGRRERHSSPA
jgi:hypothetical protein